MSFESTGSSQSSTVPLNDFLYCLEDSLFVWDDEDRETDDAWLAPVQEAMLDHHKHKVFHHCNKEYLKPPSPFIQQGPELGDSGSTIVYRVTCPEAYGYRRPLALKVIVCKENSRPPGPDSAARGDALKEVKTMSSLRHPHIVAYVASFEDYCIQTREIKRRPHGKKTHSTLSQVNQRIKKHVLGIAMYPPGQCNLRTFMDEVFQGAEGILPLLHTYFGCLSQAVAFLHRHNQRVRHKDIKPENIIIDEYDVPILTDFGLSKHFETGQYSEGPTPKTLKYAAPEAIHEERRDESSDIFSLGCVFLEMATVLLGKPPGFAEEQLAASGSTGTGPDFKYADCLPSLDSYVATLTMVGSAVAAADPVREPSIKAVLSILQYIRHMLNEDSERRPKAQYLYQLFRPLFDVSGAAGLCANCEEERRTGRAILSRSGSRSPTLNRNGTTAAGPSQGLARRGTAASVAAHIGAQNGSSQASSSQASSSHTVHAGDVELDSD